MSSNADGGVGGGGVVQGASKNSTSIILMLLVSSKCRHTSANLLTIVLWSESVWAMRAQSLANSDVRSSSSVFAFNDSKITVQWVP